MSENNTTPGPWRWEVSKAGKHVKLVGGKRTYDSYVMDFVRWGTQGAKPRFNTDGLMFDADKSIVPFPNRDHHFDWCASINHPDAKLIEATPDLFESLQFTVSKIDQVIEFLQGYILPDRAITDFDAMNTILGIMDNSEIVQKLESAKAAIAKAKGE